MNTSMTTLSEQAPAISLVPDMAVGAMTAAEQGSGIAELRARVGARIGKIAGAAWYKLSRQQARNERVAERELGMSIFDDLEATAHPTALPLEMTDTVSDLSQWQPNSNLYNALAPQTPAGSASPEPAETATPERHNRHWLGWAAASVVTAAAVATPFLATIAEARGYSVAGIANIGKYHLPVIEHASIAPHLTALHRFPQ